MEPVGVEPKRRGWKAWRLPLLTSPVFQLAANTHVLLSGFFIAMQQTHPAMLDVVDEQSNFLILTLVDKKRG
jgi:hypothetical protein